VTLAAKVREHTVARPRFRSAATRAAGWAGLLGFVTPVLAALAAVPAVAQVVGQVTGLRGAATVERAAGAGTIPLRLHSEVREGEIVRTGGDARLRITLNDQSTLALGADGELRLDHLALSAEPGGTGTLVTLALGFLRTAIVRLQPETLFRVQTPSMVAAVRGTDWIESYGDGKTEIFVASGSVLATGATEAATNWTLVNTGEGVSFITGAPHTPVVRWGQAKIDRFVEATQVP
jgi:hypothetical protein